MDSSLSPSVSSSTMNNGLCKPMKLRLDLNVVANANNGVANGGVKHPEQVKRRNARERKRVQNVNQGFVTLRNHIPQPNAKSKKLSKVETLRAAATYIQQLRQMLTTDHHNHNRHVTSNNGYNVGVASHLHSSSVHRNPASYGSNHHYDDQVQHDIDGGGGYGATSIITPSTATANYYGGGGYCPQAFSAAAIADSGDYSRSYKTSPSSGGVSAACGGGGGSPPNGFHATAGYDYVLSPPEIKQYHHMGAEFNVMQSYS